MKRTLQILTLLFTAAVTSPLYAQAQPANPGQANPAQARIQKEVMHELLMLPYYGVFDDIGFQVNGGQVTLLGTVTRPDLKSSAENVVKHIEGVTSVDNKITVEPLSPMDNQLRLALFRAIYGFPSLEKYSLGVQKPIRILVNNGQVTLEGVVDNQADKDTAGIRAKTVPNTFGVTNNLRVAGPGK